MAKTQKNKRHWLVRLGLGTLATIVLFWVGCNLVLNNWVKAKVVQKLSERTGVRWEIGTLRWMPNGQVECHQLEADVDDGTLAVESIFVQPKWGMLWQKKLAVERVDIVRPLVDVSHEWLLSLAKSMPEAEVETQPQVAQQEGALKNSAAGATPENVELQADDSEAKKLASSKPARAPVKVRPAHQAEPKPHTSVEEFDSWVNVTEASCVIRGRVGNKLLNVAEVNASVPIGGADLEGSLEFGVFQLKGIDVLRDASCILRKRGPVLSLLETELNVMGVDMQPKFQLVRAIDGFYFVADLYAPRQHAHAAVIHNGLEVAAKVQDLEFRISGIGKVTQPLNWRGNAVFQTGRMEWRESHRGSSVGFENASGQATLQRGVLHVPYAGMVGEDLSLMSNGVASMRGVGYGVVRLVCSPEKRKWVDKLCIGSQLFEGIGRRTMAPLHTPDQLFMDVHFDGALLHPMMRHQQSKNWQELWPAVKKLIQFVKDERREEQ